MADAQYIRFLRGTPEAWNKLQQKDSNTLYFISEKNAPTGQLFLGDKLIVGSFEGLTLENILGIIQDEINQNDLLVYNADENKWEPKSITKLISPLIKQMIGATDKLDGAAGLVPKPQIGDNNKFLKGDGTWSSYELTEENFKSIKENLDFSLYWDNF